MDSTTWLHASGVGDRERLQCIPGSITLGVVESDQEIVLGGDMPGCRRRKAAVSTVNSILFHKQKSNFFPMVSPIPAHAS
jgi:hypothetical protein